MTEVEIPLGIYVVQKDRFGKSYIRIKGNKIYIDDRGFPIQYNPNIPKLGIDRSFSDKDDDV